MCTLDKKFFYIKVYKAIQASITCIQKTSQTWILKFKDSKNSFYFNMASKLDFVKFEIKIIKYKGESIKLKLLISQAVTKDIIFYNNVNFLSYFLKYSYSTIKYFNLFLKFLVKLMDKINSKIIDPIFWHIKNIISDENMKLHKYL